MIATEYNNAREVERRLRRLAVLLAEITVLLLML
jgi:hypothetical protein